MIYFLRSKKTGLIKIGTTKDYQTRLYQLTAEFGPLELLGVMDGSYEKEGTLHHRFKKHRRNHVKGTEWFNPVPQLLDFIQQHTHKNVPTARRVKVVKVDEDISIFMSLLKSKLGTKTESEALRLALKSMGPKIETMYQQARHIAELHGYQPSDRPARRDERM